MRLLLIAMVLVIIAGVIGPILYKVPDYPFLWDNILFIVVFALFFNWIFFLRFTWFAKNKWVKLVILFLAIPVVIVLLDRLTDFQAYLDEDGIQSFLDHLTYQEADQYAKFIRSEMLFFGVSSIIAVIIGAFRMIVSIWRYRNRGIV